MLGGDGPLGDALRAVGPDQELGLDLPGGAVGVGEGDARCAGEVGDGGVGNAESDVAAGLLAGRGEVGEHLVLRIEPHRLTDQVGEVDAVAGSAEAQVDALVLVPGGEHPLRGAGVDEQVDAAMFEDPGPVGGPDGLVLAVVHHDAVDPGAGQQVGEHQPGGASADDADAGLDHFRAEHSCLHLRSSGRAISGTPHPGRGVLVHP